jgi:TRAP-type C4-dicarboxylate transport system permease small subunit
MIKKIFSAIGKAIDLIQKLLLLSISLFLAAMCLIIFVQVIMRYVMGQSLAWSEELTRYMFVWIIFLGINLGIKDNAQLKIDILDMALSGKKKKMLNIVQHAISLAVIAYCIGSSMILIKNGLRSVSPTLRAPMWIVYVAFPVGFGVCILELLRRIFYLVDGWNTETEEGETIC